MIKHMIKHLITGVQTGVDQAARDFGEVFGIPLKISSDARCNIDDSDGVLVIGAEEVLGETAELVEYARKAKKPCLVVDLNQYPSPQVVVDWSERNAIETLNIIGPDENTSPGMYTIAYEFLLAVIYAFPQT
jgi:hypothetical protein